MEFKHEKSLKSRLLDLEFDTWEEVHQFKREYDELKEVYAKAKAFDEILNVDYIVAPDDYAHEVTKIIDKYMEDK